MKQQREKISAIILFVTCITLVVIFPCIALSTPPPACIALASPAHVSDKGQSNFWMIIQTVTFILTLLIIGFQARQQVKALHFTAYSQCRADYFSLIRMLVDQDKLLLIYDSLAKEYNSLANKSETWKWGQYSNEDKTLYNYLELYLQLFERLYVLRSKNWIDKDAWNEWNKWLEELAMVPLLKDVWEDSEGMFNAQFMSHVGQLINKYDKSIKPKLK